MSTFYLLNNVIVSTRQMFAGELVNDAIVATGPITSAGGILWPSSDSTVASAAALAQSARSEGQPLELLAGLMQAAAAYSLSQSGTLNASAFTTTQSGQVADAAAITALQGIEIKHFTATVGHAALTAAATTQTVNIGSPLPANSRVLGREFTIGTAFSGGSISAMTVGLGNSAGTSTEIVSSEDVFTGATTPSGGTSGVNPTGSYGGDQLSLKFTSTSDNVNAATAGSVTVDIWYVAIA